MSQRTRAALPLPAHTTAEQPVRGPASVVFNLDGYTVHDAVDLPLGGRRIIVTADATEGACTSSGVLSSRVHQRVRQSVKDIPAGGSLVEVVVVKPRFVCAETACERRTFTQSTEQLPARAGCTTRLKEAVVAAVLDSGRATAEVAAAHRLAWGTVNTAVVDAALVLPAVDRVPVQALGIEAPVSVDGGWPGAGWQGWR